MPGRDGTGPFGQGPMTGRGGRRGRGGRGGRSGMGGRGSIDTRHAVCTEEAKGKVRETRRHGKGGALPAVNGGHRTWLLQECLRGEGESGNMRAVLRFSAWGGSSVGRALRSQRRGPGFESPSLHHVLSKLKIGGLAIGSWVLHTAVTAPRHFSDVPFSPLFAVWRELGGATNG
mgnify:CR=1 FL=1